MDQKDHDKMSQNAQTTDINKDVEHVEEVPNTSDGKVKEDFTVQLAAALAAARLSQQKSEPSGIGSFGFDGQRVPTPKSFKGSPTSSVNNAAGQPSEPIKDESSPSAKKNMPTIKVTPTKEGYDTETADYEPPDVGLPKFKFDWPKPDQKTEKNYLESKGKRRRSSGKGAEKKLEQLKSSEGLGKSQKKAPAYVVAISSPKMNHPDAMDIDWPPKEILCAKASHDWTPYIGRLFTDPEGIYDDDSQADSREDRVRKCNFYLGGTGKSWGLLMYSGAPCTMILEQFYMDSVAGKVIPWLFGSELSFTGSCAGGQPDGNCTIPLERLNSKSANPFRFRNGENFYERYGVRGIGIVPMIIGRTPFLLQGLIVKQIWPTKEQRNGPLGTVPIIVGPDFHERFERFLTIPSGSSEEMHLLMPSAPPTLDMLTLLITRRRELQFNVAYKYSKPADNQNGGVGVFFADKSMFNVSIPQPAFAISGLVEEIWAHFKVIEQLEYLLYAHGYRSAIDCIAIYSTSLLVVESMQHESIFRQCVNQSDLGDEEREAFLFGWSELIGSVDRLRGNGLEISFHKSDSENNKPEHAERAEGLAKLAQRIQKPMCPTCSGSSKQKPVEEIEEDGLAAEQLCKPTEEESNIASPFILSDKKKEPKTYLIMGSDYKRPRFFSGFEIVYKQENKPEDYSKRQL